MTRIKILICVLVTVVLLCIVLDLYEIRGEAVSIGMTRTQVFLRLGPGEQAPKELYEVGCGRELAKANVTVYRYDVTKTLQYFVCFDNNSKIVMSIGSLTE